MKYLLMIYSNEAADAQRSPEAHQQLFADYMAYTEDLKANGVYKGGDALHPTGTATTVRVRDGKAQNTDGPFAETKEQLGGFYMLDCKNLDEAIQWAAKIPDAKNGSIEIRPVMDFSQAAPAS